MTRTVRRTALAVAVLVLPLAAPLAAQAKGEPFTWRGKLAAGRTLEIKGVNGAVSAEAAPGDEIVVRAEKRARRSDPASVTIEVVEHADGVTICAVYPTPRNARRDNACTPDRGGQMNVQNNDVEVAFTVQVPKGVKFAGSTVNGDVAARGLVADAEVHTVNGSADVESDGVVEASTVNGSVRARMGRADWRGELAFSTVNGTVTVELPRGAEFDLKSSTVNGEIESDFPITVQGRTSRRRLNGTVGKGGRTLEVETVNGGIRLREGR